MAKFADARWQGPRLTSLVQNPLPPALPRAASTGTGGRSLGVKARQLGETLQILGVLDEPSEEPLASSCHTSSESTSMGPALPMPSLRVTATRRDPRSSCWGGCRLGGGGAAG